jgi:uroporphyrinogen decarboxylase
VKEGDPLVEGRQRVVDVIEHRRPDRVPLYGWVRANLAEVIAEAFGSVEDFEDRYEFDLAHLFGGPGAVDADALKAMQAELPRAITPEDALALPTPDPDDSAAYDDLRKQIAHHKEARGRFVYVQTPGFFEGYNGVFGIENHLLYLALFPEELRELYRRRVAWDVAFLNNCLDLGVDMIHISDDWGGQESLLFSPATWRELIFPCHQAVVQAVRKRGAYVSLHSDGNNNAIVDGILELGYDVMHPWQESAGMSLKKFRDRYRDRLTVLGGLDVQTTIGFGRTDRLVARIRRVLEMFADGGLIFCTSHFVQDHCGIDELTLAFDTAYDLCRRVCASR